MRRRSRKRVRPARFVEAPRREVSVIFDGPPGQDPGRFVEVEDAEGRSVNVGRWEQRGDYWALVLEVPA